MLITAVCWWVALSLSSGALRADQQEPPPPRRVLTVDDVLRIEEIGDVALSPDGRWLAYVIKRPRVSASDHSRSYLGGNDRGDVWIVPIEGGEPRNVTNGAAAGAGYWAPGSLMIIQGDLDYVPIAQGEEFFSALYRQNKRAAFVRYWGEEHIVQSPANIRDMWARIYDWFDRFLGAAEKGSGRQPTPDP
jgi:dipeptidyl aminopeptidase/acylaminoacyl peptidase